MDINDLPPEIHLMITHNLSLEDLVVYAGANDHNQAFFHENRYAIWRALYLRDVSPYPLENPSADAYRSAYLQWKYPSFYDLFLQLTPIEYFMTEIKFNRLFETYWQIVDLYRIHSPNIPQLQDAIGQLGIYYAEQGDIYSIRTFVQKLSYDKADAILEIWDRIDPDEERFECDDSIRRLRFGEYVAVLPKDVWLPLMRQTNENALINLAVLYDEEDGVKYCKNLGRQHEILHRIIRDGSYRVTH